LFILFVFNVKTPGVSLLSSADSLDWVFIAPAECDARLIQLANITFSLPYVAQFAINCNVAMSSSIFIDNADGIVTVRPHASDHYQ